jgi:hypothetical protein
MYMYCIGPVTCICNVLTALGGVDDGDVGDVSVSVDVVGLNSGLVRDVEVLLPH